MEELLAKMASLLQEIYDEGHGGEFRGSINLLLVQYNTAQQQLAPDGAVCPECSGRDGYHKTGCKLWLWEPRPAGKA